MIVSQIDEFPVNEAVALQLAGLQAQVLWGTFDPNLTSRYDEIEQFLPLRIIQSNKSKTREDWKKAIGNAHKVKKVIIIIDSQDPPSLPVDCTGTRIDSKNRLFYMQCRIKINGSIAIY